MHCWLSWLGIIKPKGEIFPAADSHTLKGCTEVTLEHFPYHGGESAYNPFARQLCQIV